MLTNGIFIERLIAAGVNLNLQDKYQQSEQLIAAGANLNLQDKYQQSALMMFAELGHLELTRLMITAGA